MFVDSFIPKKSVQGRYKQPAKHCEPTECHAFYQGEIPRFLNDQMMNTQKQKQITYQKREFVFVHGFFFCGSIVILTYSPCNFSSALTSSPSISSHRVKRQGLFSRTGFAPGLGSPKSSVCAKKNGRSR